MADTTQLKRHYWRFGVKRTAGVASENEDICHRIRLLLLLVVQYIFFFFQEQEKFLYLLIEQEKFYALYPNVSFLFVSFFVVLFFPSSLTVIGIGIQFHKHPDSILLRPKGREDCGIDHWATVCHHHWRTSLQDEGHIPGSDVDQSVLAPAVEGVLTLVQRDDVGVSEQPG